MRVAGAAAQEIRDELERRAALPRENPEWVPDELPEVRTLRDMLAKRRRDKTSPWRLADSDGEDAASILRVLEAVIARTDGHRAYVTGAEAEWIARLSHALQDPPEPQHWSLFVLAHAYANAEVDKAGTAALDAWVAFRPWHNKEAYDRYERCVREGLVPALPVESSLHRLALGSATYLVALVEGDEVHGWLDVEAIQREAEEETNGS
jgi:hypothetical protein